MNKTMRRFLLLAALSIIGASIITINNLGKRLTPGDPDYVAIENTLRLYLEIDAEARYTLDDSRLSEVLANDFRGGIVGDEEENRFYLKAVQWYKENPYITRFGFGLLDFWHAFYAYNRAVDQIYDASIARGLMPIPPPDTYEDDSVPLEFRVTPDPFQVDLSWLYGLPEVRELMEATGFQSVSIQRPLPETIVPQAFEIQSITVYNDFAHMVVDMYAKVDLTFAKIHGRWYIIGSRTIQSFV
jgi:hypothetical protein